LQVLAQRIQLLLVKSLLKRLVLDLFLQLLLSLLHFLLLFVELVFRGLKLTLFRDLVASSERRVNLATASELLLKLRNLVLELGCLLKRLLGHFRELTLHLRELSVELGLRSFVLMLELLDLRLLGFNVCKHLIDLLL